MLRQSYKCTQCNLLGFVLLPDDASVLKAINTMMDHHNRIMPTCAFHVDNITVYPPTEEPNSEDLTNES